MMRIGTVKLATARSKCSAPRSSGLSCSNLIPNRPFLPARVSETQRLVGEINTRWDRWGLYAIGVYGSNDYDFGDGAEWNEFGEFQPVRRESNNFFAWALEGSARFKVTAQRTGRLGFRFEQLQPEDRGAERFERALANFTVPIRIMRPALWPYL